MKEKNKQTTKNQPLTAHNTIVNEENKRKSRSIVPPITNSISANKIETASDMNKQGFQPKMASVDAYLVSSNRFESTSEHNKKLKPGELLTLTEPSVQHRQQPQTKEATNPLSTSVPADRNTMRDLDAYVPLPDHPLSVSTNPIKSRLDLEIHQSTIKSYERYASASPRTTAIDCLQEASFFKRKTWLRKVEVSKDMIKNKVQQRMRRAVNETDKNSIFSPLRPTSTITPHQTDTVKVN